jgi:hypothetical protein
MAKLCIQILPSGKTCARVALRDKPYCPAHRGADARERAAGTRFLVENIQQMDLLSLTALLCETLREYRARRIPPLHAEAVFDAALCRLEEFEDEFEDDFEDQLEDKLEAGDASELGRLTAQ